MAYRILFTLTAWVSISGLSGSLHAHQVGGGLTPPMEAEFEQIEALRRDFGDAAPNMRGVYGMFSLWDAGSTVKVCFLDGPKELREFFVRTAGEWLNGISLKIDFGSSPVYRDCRNDALLTHIRITFAPTPTYPGSPGWSYVGKLPPLPKDAEPRPTLSVLALPEVEAAGKATDLRMFRGTILHEMGHALGLKHEHQSPEANCDLEYDWDKLLEMTRGWGWDEAKTRKNYGVLTSSLNLTQLGGGPAALPKPFVTTPYDKDSIMHYSIDARLLKRGTASRCYVKANRENLSRLDRFAIRRAYPAAPGEQAREMQTRAERAGRIMGDLALDSRQLAKAGLSIAERFSDYKRKLTLTFPLVRGKSVHRSPDGRLNPCAGTEERLADAPGLSCGVAPDGSGLVIAIDPR